MIEMWSEDFSAQVRKWCYKVAVLGVDAIVDGGIVAKGDFKRASEIVANELFVRLCIHDYPPGPPSLRKTPNGDQSASADRPHE